MFGFLDGGDPTHSGAPPICDGRLGTSVGHANYGPPWAPDKFVARMAGCPGEIGDHGGFIAMVAQTSEGSTSPSGHGLLDQWADHEGMFNLGWSILGVDAVECDLALPDRGCGHEVLVGAPDLAGLGPGKVVWFTIDSGSTGSSVPDIVQRGTILRPDPADFPAGSRFGWSLTAPQAVIHPNEPWREVPHPGTEWVAIGAPGADRVAVFDIDEITAPHFSHLQTLTGPTGSGFGHAVQVGQFNADPYWDLAVGAPDAMPGGQVHVFLGTSAGLPASPDVVIDAASINAVASLSTPLSGAADELGFALAAGHLDRGVWHEALLIGVPGESAEIAVVCQVTLDASAAGPLGVVAARCDDHLDDVGSSAGDRFGHAVAVGNFVNSDDRGNQHRPPGELSNIAKEPEVAVGAPGYAYPLPGTGIVYIIATNYGGLLPGSRYPDVENPNATDPDERLGWSLHAYHTQATHWEDLWIGMPGLSPTVSSAWGGATETHSDGYQDCDEAYGQWRIEDRAGDLRTVRVWKDGAGFSNIQFVDDFEIDFRDGGGATDPVCSVVHSGTTFSSATIPGGTRLALPAAWPCSGASHDAWFFDTVAGPVLAAVNNDLRGESRAPAGAKIDVNLDFSDGGTGGPDGLSITLDATKVDVTRLGMAATCNIPPLVGGFRDGEVTE